MKNILAVLAGAALWATGWCIANFTAVTAMPGAFDEQGATGHAGILVGFLVLSLVLSLAAGATTAKLARAAFKAAIVLGLVQLTIGVFVQLAYWDLMPLWYHVPFLALLVPGVLVGAKLGDLRDVTRSGDLAASPS